MPKRTAMSDVFEKILQLLEDGNQYNVSQIAKQTGMSDITVRKYLEIIDRIQNYPKIEIKRLGGQILVQKAK